MISGFHKIIYSKENVGLICSRGHGRGTCGGRQARSKAQFFWAVYDKIFHKDCISNSLFPHLKKNNFIVLDKSVGQTYFLAFPDQT